MIIETNDFSNIEFIIKREYPKLSPNFDKEVEKYWKESVTKNPRVFNGELFGGYEVKKVTDGNLEKYQITLCRTDYKLTRYIIDHNINMPGAHTTGTNVVIYEPSSDSYVFIRRSQEVDSGKGKIDILGGVFDYSESDDIPKAVFELIQKEIAEEIKFEGPFNPQDIKPFLIWVDEETLHMSFIFYTTAEVVETTNWENSEVVRIPKKNFSEYVEKNKDEFFLKTTVGIAHLM